MSRLSLDPRRSIAAGIDLGGTKIEATLFGAGMEALVSRRTPTPRGSYGALLAALKAEIHWLRDAAGTDVPVGIGVPGVVDPVNGRLISANLVADGHQLARDLAEIGGGTMISANDSNCFTLSEATGGAGAGYRRVFGLILGTGLGGGLAVDGNLQHGWNGLAGEIGHCSLPAHLVIAYDLPLIACGCGRTGCTETLISGTGMARLARSLIGKDVLAVEIAGAPDRPENRRVLDIWTELAADLLHTIQLHLDPDCIVLGGGLSKIAGLEVQLSAALDRISLARVRRPAIVKPAFGDSSGGRGAALLALAQPGPH